jgi:hypothetical protein
MAGATTLGGGEGGKKDSTKKGGFLFLRGNAPTEHKAMAGLAARYRTFFTALH